jgi:hypothetical protein
MEFCVQKRVTPLGSRRQAQFQRMPCRAILWACIPGILRRKNAAQDDRSETGWAFDEREGKGKAPFRAPTSNLSG